MHFNVGNRVYHYCRCFFSAKISRTALKVAFVVGTVLNLINQGDAFLGSDTVSLSHLALNYLVPYLVSSHSIVKTRHLDLHQNNV